MIDTHMHGDSRSSEDFGEMYLSGIDTAITCAFYPYKLNNESTLLNHLERILNYDAKRAKEYGLDLKVALGIHPANTSVNPNLIYENLYKWIENKQIIAIGEIGLEDLTDSEIAIFKKQLDIGEETKTKVIVHTPRKNKKEVLKVIQGIKKRGINKYPNFQEYKNRIQYELKTYIHNEAIDFVLLEEDYKTKSREIFVQNCSKILISRTDFWKHKASL